MIRRFRRRRPQPQPTEQAPSPLDTAALAAWGLKLSYWRSMTDQERAWYRDNITKAPYFTSHTNV